MPSERRAVVLAGGLGTRLRASLPDLPKPLAPVAGKPFLEWVLRFLAKQGTAKAIISTGFQSEMIAAAVAKMNIPGLSAVCRAEPEPLGTAGGFIHAIAGEPKGEPWLVCNGDSLVLSSVEPLYDALERGADAAILGLPVSDAARYGSLDVAGDNRLRAFSEKRPGPAVINAGVYLLSEKAVARFPAQRPLSFETDLFPRFIENGAHVDVAAAEAAAPFLDIGTPSSYAQADAFVVAHAGLF